MTRRLAWLLLLLDVTASAFGAEEIKLEARPHDAVRIKGIKDPILGTIEKLDLQTLRFRKVNGEGCTWDRSQVVSILRRCTLQESYQRAVRAAGSSPSAHLKLHYACLKAGLKKEAFTAVKKAILVDRTHMPAYKKLLAIARASRNRDLELWALSTANDAGVATAPMLIRIAEIYARLGLIGYVEEPLRDAIRIEPRNTKAQVRLVMLELMSGELKLADKRVAGMQKLSPADTNTLVALGQLELAKGRVDLAAAAFHKASLKGTSAEAAAGLGAIYLQREKLIEAEELYAQARAIRPGFTPAIAGQALVYARKGALKKAKALLARISGPGATHPATMIVRGYIAERGGKYREAARIYEAASAAGGANVFALVGAGRCHWRTRNITAATTRFQQALALQPAFVPAIRGMARIAIARTPADAARYHKQLVDLKAVTPEDRVAFAGALMRLQRFGAAAAELAKVKKDTAHKLAALGFLAYAQGKTDDALAHFQAAVKLGDRRYAPTVIRSIKLAESRVSQSYNFDRDDAVVVRDGWNEVEPLGMAISITDKSALIDGKSGAEDRMARLVRREDASFVSIAVEAETETRSSVGVFIGNANGEPAILLYRDASGYAFVSTPGTGKPRRLGSKISPGKFSVAIGVVNLKQGTFALLVNGRLARFGRGGRNWKITVPTLKDVEALDVGLFAEAPAGKIVNCRFHSVKIVRTK